MNVHGIEIAALQPGDIVEVNRAYGLPMATGLRTEEREVVRVVATDGHLGGIVDCKRPGGRPSRSAGFEFGDAIVRVVRMAEIAPRIPVRPAGKLDLIERLVAERGESAKTCKCDPCVAYRVRLFGSAEIVR